MDAEISRATFYPANMRVERYRRHTIIASSVWDIFSRMYAPAVLISCQIPEGDSQTHTMDDLPQRFLTRNEAVDFALGKAQKWVDERLTTSE